MVFKMRKLMDSKWHRYGPIVLMGLPGPILGVIATGLGWANQIEDVFIIIRWTTFFALTFGAPLAPWVR